MARYPGDANPNPRQVRANWHRYKADVKAILSLRDTIERTTVARFERAGSGFKAHCPFHAERTPSFFVQEDQGRYRCFGAACGARGDVIQFLGDWHGLSFGDALAKAGDLAGLPPPGLAESSLAGTRNATLSAWRMLFRTIPGSRPDPSEGQQRMRPSASFLSPVPAHIELPEIGKPLRIHDPLCRRDLSIRPTHVHVYRSVDAKVSCLVLRQDKPDGGKFFLQAVWSASRDSSSASPGRWTLVRFPRDVLRPLYGLEDVPRWIAHGGPSILFVEGEKARDAAVRLLPVESTGILSISGMGGGNAAIFSEMGPLLTWLGDRPASAENVTVYVWPDADRHLIRPGGKLVDRQRGFALGIASALRAGADEVGFDMRGIGTRRIVPPSVTADGWDLADALEQGWTTRNVLDQLCMHSVPIAEGDVDCKPSRAHPEASAGINAFDPAFDSA